MNPDKMSTAKQPKHIDGTPKRKAAVVKKT